MSAFYIWNPYLIPGKQNKLEFVLTNGDVSGIAKDMSFVEHLLRDLGIEAAVQDWEVQPYRSLYYSEYLGEGNWRDDWPIVWKVMVETQKPIQTKLEQHSVPWQPSNATGNIWKELAKDELVGCLVVSDFNNMPSLQNTMTYLGEDSRIKDFSQQYGTGSLSFSQSRVLDRYDQLQIDLGQFPAGFFEKGAEYALYIMAMCQQQGGSIHHGKPPG